MREVWGDLSPAPAAAVCCLRARVPGMLQGAWARAGKEADRSSPGADIPGEQRALVREEPREREGWGFQSQGKHGKELIRFKTSFKFP